MTKDNHYEKTTHIKKFKPTARRRVANLSESWLKQFDSAYPMQYFLGKGELEKKLAQPDPLKAKINALLLVKANRILQLIKVYKIIEN